MLQSTFQSSNEWRALRLGGLLAAALTLTGCFDFEQTLTIDGNGTGSFEVMLRMDPAFQDARDDDQILPEQVNPVEISRGVRDGQFVQEEKVLFNDLSELQVQNEDLSITSKGSTFFGLGPKQLTLVRRLENHGADDEFGLMRNLFQDRYYTFTANLPGWVDQAYPVDLGAVSIEPEVRGSTVSWHVPMARAVSARELEFRVDFRAYSNVDAVVAAQRLDDRLVQFAPGFGTR